MHLTSYYEDDICRLRSAYYNQSLVLFVGAGASVEAGIPSWKEAVQQFMDGLSEKGNFSAEDNLLIPQLYFNERGSGDYIQKARDIFCYQKVLVPTHLDETIATIAPQCIITTNYDHLLEDALRDKRRYYQVICEDGEIPYHYSSHEIIKMHGDFEHNNFVLKEDDYLNYSEHFRLIETYVKALIARNTLLFVGYSLNDPDVKQILSWVKNVTGPHFQRAYFLDAFHPYDICTLNYYRNLGINIIYSDKMYEAADLKGKTGGELACTMLRDLVSGREKNGLDSLYYDFFYLDALQAILKEQVLIALHKNGLEISEEGRLCVFRSADNIATGRKLLQQFQTALSETELRHNEKETLVLRVLYKSGVREIETASKHLPEQPGEEGVLLIPETLLETDEFGCNLENIRQAIHQLDSNALETRRQEIALSEELTDERKNFLLGYIDYRRRKYFSAYHRFQSASDGFFRNNNFLWYVISESNCRLCGRLAQYPLWGNESLSENSYWKMQEVVSALTSDEILHNVPLEKLKEKGNTDIFRQFSFFTYSDDYRLDMDRKNRQTVKEANSHYMIAPSKPSIELMRDSSRRMLDFLMRNGIALDVFSDVREGFFCYIDALFHSISVPLFIENSTAALETQNVKEGALVADDLFIILTVHTRSSFRQLLSTYGIRRLFLYDGGKQYLQDVVAQALSSAWLDTGRDTFISMLTVLQLDEETAKGILEALCKADISLKDNGDDLVSFVTTNLVSSDFAKLKYPDDEKRQRGEIWVDLSIFDENGMYDRFYKKMVRLAIRQEVTPQVFSIIRSLSLLWSSFHTICPDPDIEEVLHSSGSIPILIAMSSALSEKNRAVVTGKIAEVNLDENLYVLAVLSDLKSPDLKVEKQLLAELRAAGEKEEKAREKGEKLFPPRTQVYANELINLLLDEKLYSISVKELAEAIPSYDENSRFLIATQDPKAEEDAFSAFQPAWLGHWQDSLAAHVAKNPVACCVIRKKFKAYAADMENKVDPELIFRFFRWFE